LEVTFANDRGTFPTPIGEVVMNEPAQSAADSSPTRVGRLTVPMTRRLEGGRLQTAGTVLAVGALLAAAAAVVVTLRAHFLAYPGWLALEQAALIAGPVAVGLTIRAKRRESRFGPMLIALGLLGIPYILQSTATSWPFSIGVLWDAPYYVATLAIILAFPAGRLTGRATWGILLLASFVMLATFVPSLLLRAQISSGRGPIAGCSGSCPPNAFFLSDRLSLASQLTVWEGRAAVAIPLAVISVLAWRFFTGSSPRRRALLIGQSVAVVFLLVDAAYNAQQLVLPDSTRLDVYLGWALVVTRASFWYGFLAAVIAAELFAAKVLRRIVRESLRRPSLGQFESMLRGPLGDPGLELAFWRPDLGVWVDTREEQMHIESIPSGRMISRIDQDGAPAAAIIHEAQLADDPELLSVAGATVHLAREHSLVESAQASSLRELRDSRARIASGRDLERQKIERDLHDGAQQSLFALSVRVARACELTDGHVALRRELQGLERALDEAIEELRDLAHVIYPPVLSGLGLVAALDAIASRAAVQVAVSNRNVGRYSPEIEAAVYYCCREAIQHAIKHGGDGVRVSIHLVDASGELAFEVRDTGRRLTGETAREGLNLRAMHDRVDALDGRLDVSSAVGGGTSVRGAVPLVGFVTPKG
jgi:signal transduction histidine kinase